MLTELFFTVGKATHAELARLKRRERTHVREWLAALEAMVRRLLLIEAAAVARNPAPSTRGAAAAQARAGGGASLSRREATSRRAPAFKLTPTQPPPKQHPARIRNLGAPISPQELRRNARRAQAIANLRTASPARRQARLVNRIQALAHVIADPRRAIARLARALRVSAQTAATIVAARVKMPFTFHGDARRAETRAYAALMAPNSS